jgi:hypothetical protein
MVMVVGMVVVVAIFVVDANNSILRGVHSAPPATHSGAPTLRRYAITSALLLSIASLRGVQPILQHSE